MHFADAGRTQHGDDLDQRGPAHDGVVNENHTLARQEATDGIVLDLDPEIPDRLGGLDEGAPDIVIADQRRVIGDTRLLGITQSRRIPESRTGTTMSAVTDCSRASTRPSSLR